MPPEVLFDPRMVDCSRVLVDQEGIRKVIPHRFEMEHLNAIVYEDTARHLMIGYKDVRSDEFWVRGHMPGYPLMPGVLICETAAQLCAYYARAHKLLGGDFVAFGGMDNVRFRGPVRPGDRLVIIAQITRIKSRQINSAAQGFVGGTMVFQGEISGVPFSARGEA